MSQRGNQQQQQQQQQQSNAAAAASTPAAVIVPTPAAAATAIAKAKIDFVQMDALVLLKILKHCQVLPNFTFKKYMNKEQLYLSIKTSK